jgi:5-deoxy-glucuronate isomerase
VTVRGDAISASAPANRLSVEELRLRPDDAGRVSVDPMRAGWRYLSFDLVPVGPEPTRIAVAPAHEVAIVVIAGRDVRVADGSDPVATLPGREGPFDGLPWAVWLPEASELQLRAAAPGSVAVARAPRSGRDGPATGPIVVSPADVDVEVRGAGNATRQINHIIPPAFPADRLLLVEVVTPSGNWSSWPPHKHDVDDMPTEAVLEEVYAYRFRRPEAWGIQRLYRPRASVAGPPRDGVWAVRDGEVVLVTDGYHPFVATQGDDAWYLNALAGDRRTMACSFDPALDHVRREWAAMTPDPRVPLVRR